MIDCINCKTEIAESSVFCKYCGRKQPASHLNEKHRDQYSSEEMKASATIHRNRLMGFPVFRLILGSYLTWILFHLFMLLVFSSGAFRGSNFNDGPTDFWPFNNQGSHEYDITEFLFYVIMPPLALIILTLLITPKRKNNGEESDSKKESTQKS